jgi:hypothetical protein
LAADDHAVSRTKGTQMSIFELVNEIEDGEIVLPAIQRDLSP